MNNLKVPVKNDKGETVLEEWNQGGQQSDGSVYTMPQKLTSDDHEHYFELKKPSDRRVICDCGFGGDVFPHNTVIKDGHIYDLKGNLKA